MTIKQINELAISKLRKLNTKELVEQWEMVSKMEMSQEVADIRGWLMAALEERNPEAFDSYLEDDNCTDEDLRKYFI